MLHAAARLHVHLWQRCVGLQLHIGKQECISNVFDSAQRPSMCLL
jgi:hypothetical protein